VAIPDNILLKSGALSVDEKVIMRSHVIRGVEIVDLMIDEFDLGTIRHIDILRNIIAGHHERFDGSGYPAGVHGITIPVESRIVAVADVLDALTTKRPYKEPWPFVDALKHMRTVEAHLYDPLCLQAIATRLDEMEQISRRFVEDPVEVA
jgi:HD-GYP domain-containing protein (c-di-GMP phosphodiesterase class II)